MTFHLNHFLLHDQWTQKQESGLTLYIKRVSHSGHVIQPSNPQLPYL